MTAPALSISSLGKSFPGVQALSDVSFDVYPGRVHCLLGENGAGKSTLIKILAGAQRKDEGTVKVFEKEVDFSSPIESLAAGIGVVYQELSNFAELDVAHNVFPGHLHTKGGMISGSALKRAAKQRLAACGLRDVDISVEMGQLSLSKQQMIEIARLVGENAKIVILDEPTSALTEAESEVLFRLIRQMKAGGTTIIYISHRLDEVLDLADDITVLKDGQHVATFPNSKDVTKESLVRHMVGRDVAFDFRDEPSQVTDVILEARDMTVPGELFGADITLHRGETLGIAGLEGSGRTELLQALFGVAAGASGTITKDGKDIKINNPIDAKRNGLAYITKDRKNLGLFLGLSLEDNVIAAAQEKGTKGGLRHQESITSIAQEYVDALSIKCSDTRQSALNLSGGNQQKVLLSMWLNTDPEIIMIDEPTRGVDVGAKAEIHRLLRRFAAEGNAVLLVSSELIELMASCDRILVMHEGRLVGDLTNDDSLTEEQIMALASGITTDEKEER